MRCDGGLVAAGCSIATNVPGLNMGGGRDQLVAVPYARREAGLIVGSIFAGMRTAIHIDGHGRACFPRTHYPGLDFAGYGIGHSPHPEAERPGCDMPLGLEPADTLGHGNDRLRKAQGFCASRFVEGKSRPIDWVRTAA